MNDQYYNFTPSRMLNKYLNYVAYYLWEDFHIGIENIETDKLIEFGSTCMDVDVEPRKCAKDYYKDAERQLRPQPDRHDEDDGQALHRRQERRKEVTDN